MKYCAYPKCQCIAGTSEKCSQSLMKAEPLQDMINLWEGIAQLHMSASQTHVDNLYHAIMRAKARGVVIALRDYERSLERTMGT